MIKRGTPEYWQQLESELHREIGKVRVDFEGHTKRMKGGVAGKSLYEVSSGRTAGGLCRQNGSRWQDALCSLLSRTELLTGEASSGSR